MRYLLNILPKRLCICELTNFVPTQKNPLEYENKISYLIILLEKKNKKQKRSN